MMVAFTLWQDGMKMVRVNAESRDAAWNEMLHYIFMYEQDGPVRVKEGNKIAYDTERRGPK